MIVRRTTIEEVCVTHDGGYFKATKRGEENWVIEVWTDKPFKVGWLMSMIEASQELCREIGVQP